MQIGFIGLGVMGTPMALNLARAGTPLLVWSRSDGNYPVLREAGAQVAADPDEVFARCDAVILMLANDQAIDGVLGRGTAQFGTRAGSAMIINMSTTSAGYSRQLAADIRAAGGRYVEAPVSGSRKPAEAGQLVVMLAGAAADVEVVRAIVQPLCRDSFECGEVPAALTMKLAVNLYLITMVTGLSEAVLFARQHGVDLATFAAVLNAGPMASEVSKGKLSKYVAADFTVQAAISDVLKNSRLVAAAAREAGLAAPLLEVCRELYGETEAMGQGALDMVAVIHALEQRSPALRDEAG